jgi:hypothetical protein
MIWHNRWPVLAGAQVLYGELVGKFSCQNVPGEILVILAGWIIKPI